MSRLFTPEIAAFYESFYAGKPRLLPLGRLRACMPGHAGAAACCLLCPTAVHQLYPARSCSRGAP